MRTLGLTGNRLTLSEGAFEGLASLKQLYLDQFAFFLLPDDSQWDLLVFPPNCIQSQIYETFT